MKQADVFRSPVDNFLRVQELETADDLSRIELRSFHRELANTLNVKHEVASVQKLHDVKEVRGGLERRMQVCEEGVLAADREDVPFHQSTFHIVIFENNVFTENLDSINEPSGF